MGERLVRRLLLIGWDAGDWRIMHPLLARGWMPHIRSLIDAGASGSLSSIRPPVCPMAWTSIVTGKRPHRHGILGHAEPNPQASGIRPASSTSRTCKAIWNILTQRGLRTHAINFPASHPAEPINGVCISNRFAVLPAGPGRPWPRLEQAIHPTGLMDTLAELRIRPEALDASALLPFVPRAREIDQETDRRLMTCAMLLARASSVHAAATWSIEHQPWDFAAVLYDGIEHFCRQFMAYHSASRPDVPEQDREIYRHVVTAAYCFHDMMLGRLLELAGEETTIMIVSDHGYNADPAAAAGVVENLAHRPQGIWVMHGPGVKRGAEVVGASLLDVTPTVLTLFGLPCGADMDGRPWIEALEPVGAAAAQPARQCVASWDDIPGEAGLHPRDAFREDASREAIQHLLELGYVEPPDEATRRTRAQNELHLGQALFDAGQPAEATRVLQPLLKTQPANVEVAQTLFEAHLARGRFEAAREVVESARSHGVDPALAHVALAAVDLAMRRSDAALEHLDAAAGLSAPAARLQVLIGMGYCRLRRWDAAERAFRTAAERDAEDAAAWHGLATVALAQDRDDRAVECALRATRLWPDYPEAHYHLAIALAGLGRAEEAAAAFKRCLALRPEMLPAYRGLIELYQGPLQDVSLARAYRREVQALILQKRLRRRIPAAPPWAAPSSAPSEPSNS